MTGSRASTKRITYNGTVLKGLENKYHVQKLDDGKYRLTILNVQPSDEGYFFCKESSTEHDTANMTLTVIGTGAPDVS